MTTITDEMVKATIEAFDQCDCDICVSKMRAALEAAVGPRLRELEAENSGIKGMAGVLARDVAELQAENERLRERLGELREDKQ